MQVLPRDSVLVVVSCNPAMNLVDETATASEALFPFSQGGLPA